MQAERKKIQASVALNKLQAVLDLQKKPRASDSALSLPVFSLGSEPWLSKLRLPNNVTAL